MSTASEFERVIADQYALANELGRGATAIVYRARDLRHDRWVAIKLLHPELAGAVSHERFVREIRVTARLQHPNILPLYDSGVVEDVPFYVMPVVDGESLRTRLARERRLSIASALEITRAVGEALDHAHARAIVHRDVKPENILIARDQVYVADFGIARAIESTSHDLVTRDGVVIGTPTYMSPEQASGVRELDGRSDIYSLACVCYEMLTGASPFGGDTVQDMVLKRLASTPPPPRLARPEIPNAVDRALTWALSPRAADRPATMRQFLSALEGAGGHQQRTRLRRPTVAFLSLGATLVVGASALIAFGVRRGQSTTPTAAETSFDPRRIAVLYFDDNSPQHTLGYLANGLTEGLIDELSSAQGVHVISRHGVWPYRYHPVSLDSLASSLRVGSVVAGSIQQSRDKLRVNVQLVATQSKTQLESRTIERPIGELFALEDDLSHEVAILLRHGVGTAIRTRRVAVGTTSVLARQLDLLAEQARDSAHAVAGGTDGQAPARALLARADSLLDGAHNADPHWARPLLARGWIATDLAAWSNDSAARRETIARGLRFDRGVLGADPRDPEALELRGTLEWQLARRSTHGRDSVMGTWAERDLRAALAVDSTRASAWGTLSQLLRIRGAFAAADTDARRALDQDPYLTDAPRILDQLFRSALMLADYPTAEQWCRRGFRDYPQMWRFTECRLTLLREDRTRPPDPALAWSLVRSLAQLDPPAQARAAGHPYSPIYRDLVAAAISARAGDVDGARSVLARAHRAVEHDPELATDLEYDEAYLRLVMGERDEAGKLLNAYVTAHPDLRSFIARDPLFSGYPLVPR